MTILEHTYIWEWCREHGYPLVEGAEHEAPRLEAELIHKRELRQLHPAAADRAAAGELAQSLLRALGDWSECLAWVTRVDVWENEEDWPRYYAWRATFGERRSLDAAPGHLFGIADRADLEFLLAHALECGWDMHVLPTAGGAPTGRRLFVSHDEWYALEQPASGTSVQAG